MESIPVSPESSAAAPLANLDLTGLQLGDFLVLRRLGQGGMGQVYLAEQISLKRRVALKVLRPEQAGTSSSIQRFQAEAEAVARVTHANIVQVYATGIADGIPYIALEYIEGRNLREYLLKKGTADLPVALSIMTQVGAALQRAGELGIVHRDIKPDNILLTRQNEVKVTDFGLSRILIGDKPALHLTQSGMTLGTPLYMSPEQVEGNAVDGRSDIYSFGVTCYHMMAGHPPFEGKSAFEVALQHVRDEPKPLAMVRPDLPPLLCAIIHKMLAKEPAQRYQSGGELLRDLGQLREMLNGQMTDLKLEDFAQNSSRRELFCSSGTLPVPAPPVAAARRRLRPVWLAVPLSLLGAAAAGAALAWQAQRPVEVPPAAGEVDIAEVEALFSPRKREKALEQAAGQYLNPSGGFTNVPAGFAVCLDLGLHYLESGRLEAARRHFARLAALKQVRAYHALGLLGLGIVQSLTSTSPEEAQQANSQLMEVCLLLSFGMPGGRPDLHNLEPEAQVWSHPHVRYWLLEALYYNASNGVPDRAVHPRLLRLRGIPPR